MNRGPVISQRLASRWGHAVRDRRRSLDLTQDQLAGVSGVTQQTISNIETGNHLVRDDVKIAIARALGTTPGDLFPWPPMEELVA